MSVFVEKCFRSFLSISLQESFDLLCHVYFEWFWVSAHEFKSHNIEKREGEHPIWHL